MTSCDRDNGSLCLVCLATLPTLDLSNTADDSPLGDGCLGSTEQRAATSGSKKTSKEFPPRCQQIPQRQNVALSSVFVYSHRMLQGVVMVMSSTVRNILREQQVSNRADVTLQRDKASRIYWMFLLAFTVHGEVAAF